jgi:hypothetical protein
MGSGASIDNNSRSILSNSLSTVAVEFANYKKQNVGVFQDENGETIVKELTEDRLIQFLDEFFTSKLNISFDKSELPNIAYSMLNFGLLLYESPFQAPEAELVVEADNNTDACELGVRAFVDGILFQKSCTLKIDTFRDLLVTDEYNIVKLTNAGVCEAILKAVKMHLPFASQLFLCDTLSFLSAYLIKSEIANWDNSDRLRNAGACSITNDVLLRGFDTEDYRIMMAAYQVIFTLGENENARVEFLKCKTCEAIVNSLTHPKSIEFSEEWWGYAAAAMQELAANTDCRKVLIQSVENILESVNEYGKELLTRKLQELQDMG